MKPVLLLACLSLCAESFGAQPSWLSRQDLDAARALRDRALAHNQAYALVESLTTEVGPRLAGSPGDRAAVDWAERNLMRLGFANVRRMEVIVPRWNRGTASLAIVAPFQQSFATLALGGSIGTPDEGIRARVVPVTDLAALKALPPGAAAGKIVFFTQRTDRTRDGTGYGHAVQVRAGGASAAAALGAAAIVIRSIGTDNNRLPHTGAMVYNISAPRIPAAAISNPDADLLERALRLDPGCELELKITARDLPQTRSANVIAEIPGTDRAGEIVLLGAHLDSWDPGVGAIDDGAGVAIVVAAAHLLRDIEPRPRRTVRVVLFANEEFGLSGSNTYAQREGDALARHAIAMEADLGSGPVWQLSSQVSAASLPFVAEVARALAPLGVARGTNDAKGGSDLTVLAAGGVPVIAPQLDATHYFDFHHTANDTLDKVDPQSLNQSVAAFAITAYLAARADGDLGRAPVAPPVKQP